MAEQEVQKQSWGSAFGFIMTSVGYAVGVGAIWKFPYMIGNNGGGTFLIICMIFMLILAIPLIWAELTLGRYTQKTAIAGMKSLEGEKSPWAIIGWLGFAACFIMVSYYNTIVAQIMYYIYKFASGGLNGLSIPQMADTYTNFSNNAFANFGWTFFLIFITGFVLWRGVQSGLEAVCKVIIPALFIFLIILAVRGLLLPGGIDGVVWLFTPDLSKITASTMYASLNQCFFLAGVGLASAFAFGSYLDPKESDIAFNGAVIIFSNIAVAVLAGLAIFPSLFSYDMELQSGGGLIFQTMPYVFNDMAGGRILGTMFFMLVFFAGWSSVLGLYEGCIATLSDALKIPRKKMLIILCILSFILSAPAILAFTTFSDITILGMDTFTFMDFLAVGLFCPISAMIIGLYVAYKWPFSKFITEANVGAKYFKVPSWLKIWYMTGIPIITVFVIVVGVMTYMGHSPF